MCRSLLKKQCMILRCFRYMSTTTKQTPAEYCLELVRTRDYENFLCTTLLPANIRSAAFAIRAFNVEVAQVEDQVTNNTIGMMRLNFWINTLNDVYNDSPPRNPVAMELHRILKKHHLSKYYLKRLTDARLEKLKNPAFLDLKSIEQYSENTVSSIYYLLLEALEVKNINTDHIASHVGKAHGITTLIRSVPYNACQRVNVLPQDLLMKHGVSSEAVLQRKMSKDLSDVIFEVASCAKQHLEMATSLKKKENKDTKLVFLPSICVEQYLEKLRQADFNVFDAKLQKRNHLLPLKLFWRKLLL